MSDEEPSDRDLFPEEASTAVDNRFPCRTTSRGDIVGDAPALRQALKLVDRVAPSSCTVLVTGESGTGKESMVAALHDASARRHGPLLPVNCGAIPAELAESELFGHARGAFTGALGPRKGLVAAAEGGTLFLDEVGELAPAVQVKLLRLLEQKEYVPVGDSRVLRCDIRVVAATNRDLELEVRRKTFREDLYFRLNVVHVRLPPLRERPDDIPVLAEYFLQRYQRIAGRPDLVGFTPEAMLATKRSPWVGNIRALGNCIERAVWVAEAELIGESDLFSDAGRRRASESPGGRTSERPPSLRPSFRPSLPTGDPGRWKRRSSKFPALLPETGLDMGQAIERYQNHLIEQALSRTSGNKNRAALLLGVNRTTLSEMIRRRGILPR
jgi:sigma-54 specific flagellar transcriptional regulator A